MDMNGIFDHVIAELVRFAIGEARLDPCPSHPFGTAAGMVVAAIVVGHQSSLAIDRPAKPSAPIHQGIFEPASLLHVFDHSSGCPVAVGALISDPAQQVAVLVPTLVIELYKLYILLYESPRHQAIGSISTGGPAIFPIHFA